MTPIRELTGYNVEALHALAKCPDVFKVNDMREVLRSMYCLNHYMNGISQRVVHDLRKRGIIELIPHTKRYRRVGK